MALSGVGGCCDPPCGHRQTSVEGVGLLSYLFVVWPVAAGLLLCACFFELS